METMQPTRQSELFRLTLARNITEAMREWFTGDGIKITHLYLMNCKIPKESMEGLMMILGEYKNFINLIIFIEICPFYYLLLNINSGVSVASPQFHSFTLITSCNGRLYLYLFMFGLNQFGKFC